MELRHLRYFVVLAEELHFGRAAGRLNIAPPTLSVQIQEIERTLGTLLFGRTKRTVWLTQAGEIFLDEARGVLARFDKAQRVGKRAGRGEVGSVEIGYVGSAAQAGVLQAVTRRFADKWPAVELKAREIVMSSLPDFIANGEVDAGFVRLPMTMPNSLEYRVLLRDRFCLALPSDRRWPPQSQPVDPRDLGNEKFIAPEQEAGTYEVASRGAFHPNVVDAPGSLLAVLIQVSLGVGVSVVPSAVCGVLKLPGVVYRRIAGSPISSEVAAVFRRDESSPAVSKFIDEIKSMKIREDSGPF